MAVGDDPSAAGQRPQPIPYALLSSLAEKTLSDSRLTALLPRPLQLLTLLPRCVTSRLRQPWAGPYGLTGMRLAVDVQLPGTEPIVRPLRVVKVRSRPRSPAVPAARPPPSRWSSSSSSPPRSAGERSSHPCLAPLLRAGVRCVNGRLAGGTEATATWSPPTDQSSLPSLLPSRRGSPRREFRPLRSDRTHLLERPQPAGVAGGGGGLLDAPPVFGHVEHLCAVLVAHFERHQRAG